MGKIAGQTHSLNARQKKELAKLYRFKRPVDQILDWEHAKRLTALAQETGRNIGLVFDRKGSVLKVTVGDAKGVHFPEMEGFRQGLIRLSGYAMVRTQFDQKTLDDKDLTSLLIQRLDFISSIEVSSSGLPGRAYLAMLDPDPAKTQGVVEDAPFQLSDLYPHINERIVELEKELIRRTSLAADIQPDNLAVICGIKTKDSALFEQDIAELNELCRTAGLQVIDQYFQTRDTPHARYFIGKGKIEEIASKALLKEADYLIFLQNLNAVQASHITDVSGLKVLDRTQLILDIFAQRAQSYDGKLQVELAQLKYMLPRLREKESSLSRLVGGIGGRGPGETKLEVHRRRAHDRISRLEKELKELEKKRSAKRSLRKRKNIPIVSIVGYTNAGKSTLLNTLTKAVALSENKLFATLDPFSKRLRFPHDREIIITDTVGFIHDLPKDLITAFKATLEEIKDADLLLHVVDAASPYLYANIDHVNTILKSLELHEIPQLMVLNKADLLDAAHVKNLAEQLDAYAISALERISCKDLLDAMEVRLWKIKTNSHSFHMLSK